MTAELGTDASARRILSPRRSLVSLVIGLAAGVVVAVVASPRLLPLVTWTVTVAVLLTWVWRMSWAQDSDGTKRLAEQESTTRSADVWLLAAAVTSLAVVVVALVQSSSQRSGTAVASVLLSVLSVTLSWALVNTVYAFKYARLYYLDEPDTGGIDFKQQHPPTYSDFAYMAFTVGMSFAVSETEPTSTRIRRVAFGHALLSYAFGTGVLAVAINLVTNLGQ
ncbi:DUF1345 domain-containing protein [Nocardioides sp. BP30]|uniref:DUF1345 domain-containing protein n=1 Tax=Nocardioides sp. BP30 TaxID=3036374 RepID=UPI00246884C4|nr:DUF1345 domain-containing protein [Nocardioides sp. BP30]WGL50619.1 DUF1345 domain-containing protein [Nocardioides sp. BP30]